MGSELQLRALLFAVAKIVVCATVKRPTTRRAQIPAISGARRHYADSHRGFCVEYPFVALPRDDLRLRWTMPVIYKPTPFSVSDLIMLTGAKPNPYAAYLTTMHKLSKWDYEQEWRLIDTIGDDVPGREMLLPTPSRIFLGYRISDANRTFIEAIAKDQGIALFEMIPAHEGFRLEARPLEAPGAPTPSVQEAQSGSPCAASRT